MGARAEWKKKTSTHHYHLCAYIHCTDLYKIFIRWIFHIEPNMQNCWLFTTALNALTSANELSGNVSIFFNRPVQTRNHANKKTTALLEPHFFACVHMKKRDVTLLKQWWFTSPLGISVPLHFPSIVWKGKLSRSTWKVSNIRSWTYSSHLTQVGSNWNKKILVFLTMSHSVCKADSETFYSQMFLSKAHVMGNCPYISKFYAVVCSLMACGELPLSRVKSFQGNIQAKSENN